ncbi:MAG TPA: cupredoxin domain-containing protein [Gemmatimonadota bacterium]|nr:cupredoxin domain-containing protein [Gemmatimonadota bacterium]
MTASTIPSSGFGRMHSATGALLVGVIAGLAFLSCTPASRAGGPGTQQTAGDDGTREFRIVAERFQFTPSDIEVRLGERVRLIVTSEDTTHGVAIAGFGVRELIPPRGKGETVIEFVADRPGTFTFRCAHLCGAGHAMMRGTLEVLAS